MTVTLGSRLMTPRGSRWTEESGADRYGRDPEAFFAGTRFRRGGTISVELEQRIPVERLIDRVLSHVFVIA